MSLQIPLREKANGAPGATKAVILVSGQIAELLRRHVESSPRH